ncbi:MAG: thiol peroxidase [Gammaproteobacteria bacterium]
MAKITFKGKPVLTVGELPLIGSLAPDCTLTKTDLSDVALQDFRGKKVILSIFPSLDTPTCATAMRKFNEKAGKISNNAAVLCISADLPFAQSRFCGAEGLQHVIPLSTFRHPEFGLEYGVTIAEGPLEELMSRAVVVLDEKGKVIYTQQVAEITEEPDYEAVLKVLQ